MSKDEELDHLRQENKELKERVAQLEALVQKLQEQMAKDSHNSSKPPSSDGLKRRTRSLRQKSGKKPGAQPGHRGHHLQRVEQADEVIVHRVCCCRHCGQALHDQPATQPESRQVFDVPPHRLWVVEHRAEEKRCSHCDKLTRAAFPAGVGAPSQYGPGLAGLAVYLVEGQCVPYARAAQLLQEWFGIQMSAGSLPSFLSRCHQQLAEFEAQLKEALTKVPVLHQDETGMRVKQAVHWVHVASTSRLTHLGAHLLRGWNGMQAIGIAPLFQGTSVHDGLMSYWNMGCQHALCNAHHLRELTFVEEEFKQAWALEMKDLLLKMKKQVEEAKASGAKHLDPLTILALSADYDRLLEKGWKANPLPDPSPPREGDPPKKRSRKQSAGRKLLHRLQVHQPYVLAFLHDFAVPFDNNQAERDLRMLKVHQKVSGSLRTPAGLETLCRIRSYLSTLHKQGMDLCHALQQTLSGQPVLPAF
jgi:transposase